MLDIYLDMHNIWEMTGQGEGKRQILTCMLSSPVWLTNLTYQADYLHFLPASEGSATYAVRLPSVVWFGNLGGCFYPHGVQINHGLPWPSGGELSSSAQ